MAETGEPWSTKSQSRLTGQLETPPTLHVEPSREPVESAALNETALALLLQAAASNNALLRANALEGMQYAPENLEPLVARGVVDPNRGVRFVAAMTIGEFGMQQMADQLEPLLDDESRSVQAAAIFGLKACGRPADLSPLASMIVSDDPEVRGNAAMVLGELGNPSAVPMIRRAVGRGMKRVSAARVKMVDLQLAEALVKLGEEREIEVIRAALFSAPEQGEITALACMICGRLNDERAGPNLVRLALQTGQFQQPAEIRMAAVWALAHISPAEASIEVPMSFVTSPQFQLRLQAALTLGEIGDPASLATLGTMMGDDNPLVQVAAASAVLQIQNPRASRRNRF